MNDVEEIKNRLDIVEVIGGYVPLKQAGRNFKGLSPFQQEKTPSFMVSPEKNIWYDFSSGQGGDVISFVMKMEGVEFPEALELLAGRAGVSLTPRSGVDKSRNSQKSLIYSLMKQAVEFYQDQLSRSKSALSYLKEKRHLTDETIKTFQIGYAPDSWEAMSRYLRSGGYSVDVGQLAGLVGQKAGRTNSYDLFRDRIMFPIFDPQGRPIGFTGRVLSERADSPKYINTPQSPIYHKSRVIFGLSQAKEAIRLSDEVVVVEGNMDVLSLHQAGQKNTVAVSGTALTTDQLVILSRLSKNIKLCLDNDAAGQKATLRAVELAGGLDISLSIVSLKSAKDPDEVVSKDPSEWAKLVQKAEYGMDFIFSQANRLHDSTSGEGKKKYADFILPFITNLRDSVERAHYVKKLAQNLDTDEATIHQKIESNQIDRRSQQIREEDSDSKKNKKSIQKKLTKIERLELAMLEFFIPFKLTRDAIDEVDLDKISPRFVAYFRQLKSTPEGSIDKIAKNLRQLENNVKIIALRGEQEYSQLSDNDLRLEAYTQVHRWQKEIREIDKRRLTRLIAQAEQVGDVLSADNYLTLYQEILSEES